MTGGGGQSDPRVHKFACYGRKTKKNPKRKDGKSPPQAPQPHLHPEISSYIQWGRTRRLWSQLIVYFHLISSYTRVRVKKPLKSPVRVGLSKELNDLANSEEWSDIWSIGYSGPFRSFDHNNPSCSFPLFSGSVAQQLEYRTIHFAGFPFHFLLLPQTFL